MALSGERDGESYPLTPRLVVLGIIGGTLFVLGWCYLNGFTLKLALPYFLILLLYVTVQIRIRAETGMPLGWDYPFGTQKSIFSRVLGTDGIISVGGERGLVMLSYYSWLSRYNFLGHTAAYQIDNATLWEEQRIQWRRAAGFIAMALIIGLALASAAILLAIGGLAARSLRRRVVSGREEMIGATGQVTADAGDGNWWIRVHGENWRARSGADLQPGSRVKVERIDGLTLEVSPAATHTTTGSTPS